jgi:hypothetical protein
MGYGESYALKYNPFSLQDALEDLRDDLAQDLVSAPLQIAEDNRLVDFYSNEIYEPSAPTNHKLPFDYFTSSMTARGYLDGSGGQKAIGKGGRVILIRGPQGTGKTTLAHRMMSWLKSCGDGWHPVEWKAGNRNPEQQKLWLDDDFVPKVTRQGAGYFLCLVEDIQDDADDHLIDLYQELVSQITPRTLFLFITTDDGSLRRKTFGSFNPPVLVCETTTLTADQAVAYCRTRIVHARSDDAPAWIAQYPLFPFTEDIVQKCLLPLKALAQVFDKPGSIGVRELNKVFAEQLENRIDPQATFNIRNLAVEEVSAQLIYPAGVELVAA